MSGNPFQIKRIYENPSKNDGYRVLVDRLWPRGVSKKAAQLDEWLKDISPSPALRKWFDHDPKRFNEFKQRYETELVDKKDLINDLIGKAETRPVTLLYASKDQTHNHAIVLKDFLNSKY